MSKPPGQSTGRGTSGNQPAGAPYAQIVADIRSEIAAGALAPGGRVPSTRQIMRHWGVAMATATKALTALRQEGLIHAIPGVGTVVSGPAVSGPAAAGRQAASSIPALGRAGPSRSGPGPSQAGPGPSQAGPGPSQAGPGPSQAGPGPSQAGPGPSQAEPGPGPGRSTGPAALTTARIVTAAIAVADSEGLAGLSMRRVATETGAATMSLYRHVADKDDLLLRMMDAALAECAIPDGHPGGWREELESGARELWAAFRRHPWLAPALSVTRPQPIPSGLAGAEWMLAALDGIGLDPATMLTAYLTLVSYVRGTAMNLELEAEAEAATGLDHEEWMQAHEPALRSVSAAGQFPVFERITAGDYDFSLDALFEFGLQRLLDGLAALIGGARAAAVPARPRP
jgi:DNA-binding transcriptional regulator YhcF (GntR family)/AcrR family transcriptional regulator